MMKLPAHDDLWRCEFREIPPRPVVVITRDAAILWLTRTLVPHARRTSVDFQPKSHAVNVDSVENVGIGTLTEQLGTLPDARMRDGCAALAVAVDRVP